jgi:surfactin synthase thioesterase subunit
MTTFSIISGAEVQHALQGREQEVVALVDAAYRHDCVSAHRYLADALDAPPAGRLSAPVTVVVAADDPVTEGFPSRHRDWRLLAEHVDLHELADGGHYFLRTRPTEAAEAVRRAAELLAASPTSG